MDAKVGGSSSEVEVTWEDQQKINKFSRLNTRFHELEDEIKVAKVIILLFQRFHCQFTSFFANNGRNGI